MSRVHLTILGLAVAACCSGCGDETVSNGEPPSDDRIPDFMLEDWNATSPSYQQAVSPRDQLGKISAWFFGYST